MNRQQKNDVAETAVEQPGAVKPRKRPEPLDPATLKPEAAEMLGKGGDALAKLQAAAEAVELLGLSGMARQLWETAERAYAAAEREARKIQREGGKAEREAKAAERKANAKAKKAERIAKLRKQLEELLAAEEAAASDG